MGRRLIPTQRVLKLLYRHPHKSAQEAIGEKIIDCVREGTASFTPPPETRRDGLVAEKRVAQTDDRRQNHSNQDDIQPSTCYNPTLRLNFL